MQGKKFVLIILFGILVLVQVLLSIEAALLASQGEVYAIEKKDLAVDLLHQNIAKFKLEDKVKVIATEAPKGIR